MQLFQPRVAEAAAHIAGVLQFACVVVIAKHQRTQARARTLGLGVAADHELLALHAFKLDPMPAAARRVGRSSQLSHDPFQPQLARRGQQRIRVGIECFAQP